MFNGSEIAYLSYKRLPSPVDIRLGDDTSVRVTHHGTLLVQRQEIDALHLPTFQYPLLSVHRLARQGHTITAIDQDCIILDKQSIITMTGRSDGNLYQLDSETQALAADTSLRDADIQDVPMPDAPMALLGSTVYTPKLPITESTLWHRCLGHLNIAAMKSLVDGYTDPSARSASRPSMSGRSYVYQSSVQWHCLSSFIRIRADRLQPSR